MFGAEVELSMPPAHWFGFPPSNLPQALPPPVPIEDEFTLKAPFAIDSATYNKVLSASYPITFVSLYLISVVIANIVNGRRKLKPWSISKTGAFRGFVLFHNFALAVFSAFTCVAMVRAVSASWPGLTGEHGLPGAVDALCKMTGPRGFGDAITYNSSTSAWASKNTNIILGTDLISPDSTDVGRIWNEGLAFWGWVFYLSKYYEIVDNVIILVKGKRCSTLQIYHHAGALLCMWAGIRYMSPPIWMFVLVNSGIHTMMYTYYTHTGLGYKVSPRIKKTITTLQIAQFVVGATFAVAHLFISYSVPVSIPYTVRSVISSIDFKGAATSAATAASSAAMGVKSFAADLLSSKSRSSILSAASKSAASVTDNAGATASSLLAQATDSASSLASQATDSASSLAVQATETASSWASKAVANDGVWLKKLLYRAAGREALAEAVRNPSGELFGPEFDEHLIQRTVEEIREEIRYYTEYQTVRCLDTDGQAFAIWLNVAYLTPLTLFFLNFFRRNYTRTADGKHRTVSESAQIAARQTSKSVERMGKGFENSVEEGGERLHVGENFEKAKQKASEISNDIKLEDRVEHIKENIREMAHSVMGSKDSGEVVEEQESSKKSSSSSSSSSSFTTKKESSSSSSKSSKQSQVKSENSQESTPIRQENKEDLKPAPAPAGKPVAMNEAVTTKPRSASPAKKQQPEAIKVSVEVNDSASGTSSGSPTKKVKVTAGGGSGSGSASSSTSSLPTPSGKAKGGNGNGGSPGHGKSPKKNKQSSPTPSG